MPLLRESVLHQLQAGGYTEGLHPRDAHGRWLRKGDEVEYMAGLGTLIHAKVRHIRKDGTINVESQYGPAGNTRTHVELGMDPRDLYPPGGFHGGNAPPEPVKEMDLSKPNVQLTPDEQRAVLRYAWDLESYHAINGSLRQGNSIPQPTKKPDYYLNTYNQLRGVTERGTLTSNVRLYRTISQASNVIAGLHVGQVFTDPGFMSTSHDRSKAEEMLDHDAEFDAPGSAAMFQITAPRGSHGFVLGDSISKDNDFAYDQGEVILPPGSRLRIDHVGVPDSNGIVPVKATVV